MNIHPKLWVFALILLFASPAVALKNIDEFNILCIKLEKRLEQNEKLLDEVMQPVDSQTSIYLKKEFSKYIIKKIEFLQLLLDDAMNGLNNIQQQQNYNYFSIAFPDHLYKNFVNYISEITEKYKNDERMKTKPKTDSEAMSLWATDLVGRSKEIGNFVDVLIDLQHLFLELEANTETIIKQQHFGKLVNEMNQFIKKLIKEIIFGQTSKQLDEMEKRLSENQRKIDGAIKKSESWKITELLKKGINYNQINFKKLFLEYKNLNNFSWKLFKQMKDEIGIILERRAKNHEVTFGLETTLLGKKFKNAFNKIASLSKTMSHKWSQQLENKKKPKAIDLVNPEEAKNWNFDKPTWLDHIEHDLSLPDEWVKTEEELMVPVVKDKTDQSLRAMVRLHAGMILMAWERMKKCF